MIGLYHTASFQGSVWIKREYNERRRKEVTKLVRSDFHLKKLLEYIHAERGIDFSLYRHAAVVRKIDLRIQTVGCRDYKEYLAFLKAHPGEMQDLVRTITLKASNFFRNPLIFELLHITVIPDLVAEFGFLKAWSIGCAYGEEPYSVAMIVRELVAKENLSFAYNIQGTDVYPDAIERAVQGEYPEGELVEAKQRYIETYFTRNASPSSPDADAAYYQVNSEIRSMVRFSCTNIMDQLLYKRAYLGNYNLVLCRNVLVYMNMAMQEELFRALANILYEKGCLVLGETETIPESVQADFEQPFPGIRVFKKRRSAAAH